MGRIRIYPEKENTIASGIFEDLNSAQNAVTDLWYGGGVSGGRNFRNSISRHLIYFDLSTIQQKISNKTINTGLTVTYRLRFKNAIPSNKTLAKEYEFDQIPKSVASSFDLIAFPINKAWDAGRGHDMLKERVTLVENGPAMLTGYSNWNSATSIELWDEPGIYENPTASTSSYVSQHFDIGNEDINMDITSIVNEWLNGITSNNGLAIAYNRVYELMSSGTKYISSFFTNKTNFSFKPFIEVIYDAQFIVDDRMHMTNNRPGKLFLYTFSGNSAANYYSASTVDIINSSNNSIVHADLNPIHFENGVYYVNVFMSAATRGQKYKDVWKGVSFNPAYDSQNIENTFVIQDNYYTGNIPSINDYSIDIYGLPNGGILSNDEIIRVYCDLRMNYSLNIPAKNYVLKYKLILNNQEEIIPWTPVNQVVIAGTKSNYFNLDTSWLLHNQTYDIHFKIEELGTSRILSQKVTFKIQRPFN